MRKGNFQVEFNHHVEEGITNCELSMLHGEEWETVGIGQAVCSENDQFSKVAGRKYSFLRALSNLTREQKTGFWDVLRTYSPKTVEYSIEPSAKEKKLKLYNKTLNLTQRVLNILKQNPPALALLDK